MDTGFLTEVQILSSACVRKTALKRLLLPKRAGSISAESSVMASSTKFTANFTDEGCLGVAKVDPKTRSFLVTHSSCFPSCSFTIDEGLITILGVYQVTGRGRVGKNSKETWAGEGRASFSSQSWKKCQCSRGYSVERTKPSNSILLDHLFLFYIFRLLFGSTRVLRDFLFLPAFGFRSSPHKYPRWVPRSLPV